MAALRAVERWRRRSRGCRFGTHPRSRAYAISVRLHDGHAQTGDAHVKQCHRRTVDETKPNAFTWVKQCGPVRARGVTIHQVNVGDAGYIGDVGGGHIRASPLEAIVCRGAQAFTSYVVDKRAGGTLVVVVIIALLFQVGVEAVRVL